MKNNGVPVQPYTDALNVNMCLIIMHPQLILWAWTKELKDTNPLMSSLLVICLGWCSNFVGSESGQKQSVKLLQNMGYSTIQHPPRPQSHTLSVYMYCTYYTVHLVREGGKGGLRSERRKRGNSTQVLFLRPWGQQFTS